MTYTEERKRWRSFVWHRDNKTCGLCGKKIRRLKDMHMDHIIQHHHGGASVLENLRATHASCNRARPKLPVRVFDMSKHPDRAAQEARKAANRIAKLAWNR